MFRDSPSRRSCICWNVPCSKDKKEMDKKEMDKKEKRGISKGRTP